MSEPRITLLSKPEYEWEKRKYDVNEGPAVLIRNGRVFMTFSASAIDANYCLGLLTASADADLLDRASWRRRPHPALDSSTVPGEFGPGHVSFTEIDDELWMTYHAMPSRAPGPRHAGLRRVRFSPAGRLELGSATLTPAGGAS